MAVLSPIALTVIYSTSIFLTNEKMTFCSQSHQSILDVNYPDFSGAHMKFPVTSVALAAEGGVLLHKHCIAAVGCMYACWRNA